MAQEPLTLYKLIILYMLNRVSFPLTKAQVIDFLLGRDYTNFPTFQQAISELEDTGLITLKSLSSRTHLLITPEGREALEYFGNQISDAIKKDADGYLTENELELRNEVSIQASYYKSTNGEFEAELTARDRDRELVHIRLSVPLEEMASVICDNWQAKNQEIYKYLTEQLF